MREPFDADDPRLARAAWSRLAEPGDAQAAALVNAHGPVATLRRVLDGAPGTQRWAARLPDLAPGRDLAQLQRWGGRMVCPGDAGWPAALDDLGSRRPFCLWVRGPLDLAACADRAVAVVGARAATAYGEHVAGEIAAGAADRGFTVVSGGAYGIDGAAHRATLAVEGATVAVLACGVERAYPRGHEALLTRIAARGAVVSEVPPGSAPTRWRFLERNRLIAALAAATVVVEAAWRSGALSTAGEAARLLRPVGAVPGPVTSAASAGCHRLLREQRAVCVTDAEEVVELAGRLGDDLAPARPVRREDVDDLDPDDRRLYEALPLRRGRDAGSIGRVAGLEAGTVRAGLARLELSGLAERVEQAASDAQPWPDGPVWRRAPRPRGSDR